VALRNALACQGKKELWHGGPQFFLCATQLWLSASIALFLDYIKPGRKAGRVH
jgi:hypothetical protein